MPLYIFQNPETGEIKEVVQSMNQEHTYTEDGTEWDRVWTTPQVAMDVKIDPFSTKQFVDKTNKPGTYGDLMDRSAELSEARAEKNGGVDPVKQKFFDDYSKTRGGKRHPEESKNKVIEI
jgi:hypothetical protein